MSRRISFDHIQKRRSRVFLAKDECGKKVVIKAFSPQFTEEFGRELSCLQRFPHPNIIKLLDSFSESHGKEIINCLVLEYLEERELRLSRENYREVVPQISAAFTRIHMDQIIHRDINPRNILLGAENQIKVIDFEDASAFGVYSKASGRWAYCAPEVFMRRWLDKRTDVYSLSITFAEIMGLQFPGVVFDIRDASLEFLEKGHRLIHDRVVSSIKNSFLTPKIKQILLIGMEYEQTKRTTNVAELSEGLLDAITNEEEVFESQTKNAE